ncbi:phosphate ABC transporter permease subunit PstC [Desulfovibrio litoralis]|uniref:Phosphate transport system permease protein n=1 Tax=Desulfovibrio litoralis DSM 11393 TaxID=1121455 RepID=A0A1M7SP95_9BACT|nr:phosphate ABC transporter permease subunit PstC [Desulfovibrio litoralis]SHN60236.1 phosphate transport system permease protein [Desulfovibrio litoralis DSM 11393]
MSLASKKEQLIKIILAFLAACSLFFLLLIVLFLFIEGIPLFTKIPIWDFITGFAWYPAETPPEFGIFPMIIASFAVTIVATLIAMPLGLMTAVYLTELAPSTLRRIIKPIIELLAALPSVVIGFFGMVVLAPLLQEAFDLDTGLNLFNAALMLAFMSVPTICSVAEDSLFAVPGSLREASLALGATKLETITKVTIPAAFSGLATAVMLGMSRSIGETMVVLMVAGGAGIIPSSLFDPVRPLPAIIAAEIAEAPFRGEHYQALFCIALLLFLFTFLFNFVAYYISEKHKQTL